MEGYITSKKQLRDVLNKLEVGQRLTLSKANFWCRDLGYHYDLFISREDEDTYVMTFTDYHAMYSNHPRKDLDSAVESAWDWIRKHNTRKYRVVDY